MKRLLIGLAACVFALQAVSSVEQESKATVPEDLSAKIDSLRAIPLFGIDSVHYADATVEAWMEFTDFDLSYVITNSSVSDAEPWDVFGYVLLNKFFRTVRATFKIFEDAKEYRVVVFDADVERDQYGNVIAKRRLPMAKLRMNRDTCSKVNWDYVEQILFLPSPETFSRSSKHKLLAMLDAYWTQKEYKKSFD